MIISANPLHIETFSKFGSTISPDDEIGNLSNQHRNANYGTAIKLTNVSYIQNNFPENQNVRIPNWDIFRCFTESHLKRRFKITSNTSILHNFLILEKHPYTSQTFVPLGGSPLEISYLVIVALSTPDGKPDLSTIKTFIGKGNQAVTYNCGIWHAPMLTLGNIDYLDFCVLSYELLDKKKPEFDSIEYKYHKNEHNIRLFI